MLDDLDSVTKLAWLAGLIEGEAYIGCQKGKPVVTIVMVDEDVLRRARDWSGLGWVSGPRAPVGTQKKPTYQWSITRRDDAAAFIRSILPFLGSRRSARALKVLAEYEAAGPTRGMAPTCSYGHDISEGSPNLRLVADGKYTKRRCLACQVRRQREHRERKTAQE